MADILVIDDDVEFRAMISDYFTDLGHTLRSANNGREGIAKARAIKPDMIFLDVMMPDVGGIEMLRDLQAEENTRDIPVLVITGAYFNKSMSEFFKQEPNCREFISKSVDMPNFREKVEKILAAKTGK